jgi:hypothetical protein
MLCKIPEDAILQYAEKLLTITASVGQHRANQSVSEPYVLRQVFTADPLFFEVLNVGSNLNFKNCQGQFGCIPFTI